MTVPYDPHWNWLHRRTQRRYHKVSFWLKNEWRKRTGKSYTVDGVSGVIGRPRTISYVSDDGKRHEFTSCKVEFKPFTISGPPATREEMEAMGWHFFNGPTSEVDES
jgi:hypothetical protein